MKTPPIAALAWVLIIGFSSDAHSQAAPQRNMPQRAELEQRVRDRIAQVVRRRLELNDDQMSKLSAANQQFDRDRLSLVTEERQTRIALRGEVASGNAANQQKVAGYLDQLMRLQRRRLDLVESEQRELAKFLTPVQRAKFFALQTEIRQRMQELRDGAPGRGRRPMNPPGQRNLP